MITRKLMGANTVLAGALLAGGLSQSAGATEELVVYGTAATVAIGVDQRMLRSEAEQYIRSFNQQVRAAVDQGLKRQLAPKVELASSVIPTRG